MRGRSSSGNVCRSGASPAAPPMHGLAEMVCGRYEFLHDMEWPGMLHARIVRPPHVQARLEEASDAVIADLEAQGIRVIRDGSFLAVAGPIEWPVVKAAVRLGTACRWTSGGGLPECDVFAELRQGQCDQAPDTQWGTGQGSCSAASSRARPCCPLRTPLHIARVSCTFGGHGQMEW